MDPVETNRFNELYQRHLQRLKLQGKSQKTIDAYARAVRRIGEHFDCCPDQLTLEQRENYFSDLVASHSWSTLKIDRNGLQFFWGIIGCPLSFPKLLDFRNSSSFKLLPTNGR